jgi:hypothetical protein
MNTTKYFLIKLKRLPNKVFDQNSDRRIKSVNVNIANVIMIWQFSDDV